MFPCLRKSTRTDSEAPVCFSWKSPLHCFLQLENQLVFVIFMIDSNFSNPNFGWLKELIVALISVILLASLWKPKASDTRKSTIQPERETLSQLNKSWALSLLLLSLTAGVVNGVRVCSLTAHLIPLEGLFLVCVCSLQGWTLCSQLVQVAAETKELY